MAYKNKKTLLTTSSLALLLMLSACGHQNMSGSDSTNASEDSASNSDPLEPINRPILHFNRFVDTIVLKPIARAYVDYTPQQAQDGVRNFLRNLRTPTIMANQLLQGEPLKSVKTLGRFLVNSTIGIGGLIDVAGRFDSVDMKYETADFGQTLGVWGVGPGPYLMLPILGPSTVRDGVGLAADTFSDPLTIYATHDDKEWINYTRLGLTILDTRAEFLPVTDDLEKNSLDYYASLRSMYLQRREALINKNSNGGEKTNIDYPDYPE